mgnify:CR=1 FL=1
MNLATNLNNSTWMEISNGPLFFFHLASYFFFVFYRINGPHYLCSFKSILTNHYLFNSMCSCVFYIFFFYWNCFDIFSCFFSHIHTWHIYINQIHLRFYDSLSLCVLSWCPNYSIANQNYRLNLDVNHTKIYYHHESNRQKRETRQLRKWNL